MVNIDAWQTLSLGAVAVGQTLFVILYVTFPWYRSFLGRALFAKAVALAVLVDAYMLYRIFPFDHADKVFATLYTVLAVGVWFQFFAFLRVRVEGRQGNG